MQLLPTVYGAYSLPPALQMKFAGLFSGSRCAYAWGSFSGNCSFSALYGAETGTQLTINQNVAAGYIVGAWALWLARGSGNSISLPSGRPRLAACSGWPCWLARAPSTRAALELPGKCCT